jgi:hypothetical protein
VASKRRAQVLPAFSIMIGVLLLLAALVIDGVQSLGTRSNIETITWVTARRLVDDSVECGQVGKRIVCSANLSGSQASAVAIAGDWVRYSGNPNLRLSSRPVDVAAISGGVELTLRFCYKPFLELVFRLSGGPFARSDDALFNSPHCVPGEVEIVSQQRSIAVPGS